MQQPSLLATAIAAITKHPSPFYVNVYRERTGELMTYDEPIHDTEEEAGRVAAEAADQYDHTLTHEGVKYLHDYFSDEWHEEHDSGAYRDLKIAGMRGK